MGLAGTEDRRFAGFVGLPARASLVAIVSPSSYPSGMSRSVLLPASLYQDAAEDTASRPRYRGMSRAAVYSIAWKNPSAVKRRNQLRSSAARASSSRSVTAAAAARASATVAPDWRAARRAC